MLFSYNGTDSGIYYLIFYKEDGSASLRITIVINQTLYVVTSDIVARNCSISLDSDESCSLSVDYASNYTKALLQLEQPRNVEFINWEASHRVYIGCPPRAWLYAVIGISMLVGAALFVVVLVIAVVFVTLYRRKMID